ncbi:MAG: acyl-CoA dehydrogenase family protein, partial [Peptococcaceae bacterium]|nr:acyl-CoA dehydrogenase family protein [Peptococcaceae bacterium]
MNFQLTEEQQLVRASVREFCQKYVEPIAQKVDQEPYFPMEN